MRPAALFSITATGLLLSLSAVNAHDPVTTRVTWTGEIARIVQARCVSCHAAGGRGPMPLTTYAEARPWAKAIREEVLTRRMPKWHAVRGYGDFRNDPSLSSFEIALIGAWADGGAPYGTDAGQKESIPPHAETSEPKPEHPSPSNAREVSLECREQSLPDGELLAIRPSLAPGGSIGLAIRLPGGKQEIVGWICDFDPSFATTYWLRTPLRIARGSRLVVEGQEGDAACRVGLTVARPGSRKAP